MQTNIRSTYSVCPQCLSRLEAVLVQKPEGVYLEKTCPVHGSFSVPVWRGYADMEQWRGHIPPQDSVKNPHCPHGCADCSGHMQGVCCVLLEVTRRCNLSCNFCFAQGDKAGQDITEPGTAELQQIIASILSGDDKPLLQFSGGEPTLRDDLPELVAYARSLGCRYTQLNSNGIRLAEDEAYVSALAKAGLSFVFMQFDGVDDEVYQALRGTPLLAQKLKAIEMCDRYRIGVSLVPTLVRGVNDHQVGEIIRLGASLSPAVRGVHFQPVSYFGRYPALPGDEDRITLDELFALVSKQAGIALSSLLPSRCDHPLCGFHGSFLVDAGELRPLSHAGQGAETGEGAVNTRKDGAPAEGMTSAKQNREYVGRRWSRDDGDEEDTPYSGDTEADACCDGDALETETDACCDWDALEAEAETDACCGDTACCCGDEADSGDDEACCCGDADSCCDAEADSCCDWDALEAETEAESCCDELDTFDSFLRKVRKHGFTISAMAFQDAMNLDAERLQRCSLRVYHEGILKPFCIRYLSPMKNHEG